MTPNAFLILAAMLFLIGTACALVRRNLFFILLGVELMLNAVNLTLVTFSRIRGEADPQVLAFFVMALAAAEACVGLTIVVLFFRKHQSVQADDAHEMGD